MQAPAPARVMMTFRKSRGRKTFFFGKKEPKNFCSLRALAPALPNPSANKSFFASFFAKKEVLSSLRHIRVPPTSAAACDAVNDTP
jgi:hypothetical protein